MKAIVLRKNEYKKNGSLQPYQGNMETLPMPCLPLTSSFGESPLLLIKMHYVALNHRDLWIMKGLYPKIIEGSVLGGDGMGWNVSTGERGLIYPGLDWDEERDAPKESFHILGLKPAQGTFCEYMVISPDQWVPVPDYLTDEEAAALPLAGLTAYRAVMTKGKIQAHHHVLITGIGGGVALFCLQFVHALGAQAYVTSGHSFKIHKAKEMGAIDGFLYTQDQWWNEILLKKIRFDCIIDGAGGEAFTHLLRCLRPNGIFVSYGVTAGSTTSPLLSLPHVFLRNIEIKGTSLGSPQEFKEMLKFMEQHRLRPILDQVYSLNEFQQALDRMTHPHHFGKIILQLPFPSTSSSSLSTFPALSNL